ncbi:iron-containing alcohol dehydrogenase [Allopusillimonas ginsengisoli]|uniref:iron-containing alcohol dehydrogenase n=1 Tax=Allopusillimonas ginsengisoli TaxID=453575 RepID=UPI0010C21C76|nr:iron-containing alcohol dehydrogenase [Allopusillimonas ginsengisoli]
MAYGVFRSPAVIYFGTGQRKALPRIVAQHGQRVFICTDERFFKDPLLAGIEQALKAVGIATLTYDRTIAELPASCIQEATALARDFNADVFLGIGGGSCQDLAKLVSLSMSYGDDLRPFYGEFKVPGKTLPVIAVPTTAGTGSEVTPVAVLGDPERVTKVGISSPYLIPVVAVCDPELTLTCPPRLTAIAGADAMTHALEAFTAIRHKPSSELSLNQVFIGKNIFSDVQARSAIAALGKYLPTAVEDGSNLLARERVMYGSLAAGLAFGAAGTAAAHAIQYPIGALTHTAHGLGVATLMPYVMEFNFECCVPELAEIAHLCGLPVQNEAADARDAIDAVEQLFSRIGIPSSLQGLNVTADKLEWVAKQSMLSTRLINNNPRALTVDSIGRIVNAAYAGDRSLLRSA